MGISTIDQSLKNIEEDTSLQFQQKNNVYKRNMVLRCRIRPRSILMKRRRALRLEGPRRSSGRGGGIERRVKTLKRLVPNSNDCSGLDGLFRNTADYILLLQMKVKMMQIMVKALSNNSDESDL